MCQFASVWTFHELHNRLVLDQIGNHQRSTHVGFPTNDVDHLHIAARVVDVVAAGWCFQVSVWVCVDLDDVENFALSLEHDL